MDINLNKDQLMNVKYLVGLMLNKSVLIYVIVSVIYMNLYLYLKHNAELNVD